MSQSRILAADDLAALQRAAEILGVALPDLPEALATALGSESLAQPPPSTSANDEGDPPADSEPDRPRSLSSAPPSAQPDPPLNLQPELNRLPSPTEAAAAFFSHLPATAPSELDADVFGLDKSDAVNPQNLQQATSAQMYPSVSSPFSSALTIDPIIPAQIRDEPLFAETNITPAFGSGSPSDVLSSLLQDDLPAIYPGTDAHLPTITGSDLPGALIADLWPIDLNDPFEFLCDATFTEPDYPSGSVPLAPSPGPLSQPNPSNLDFLDADAFLLSTQLEGGTTSVPNIGGPSSPIRPRRARPSQAPPGGAPVGIPRKRKPYDESRRQQTSLTRQIRGCIRCRMNRKRCIPDPEDPRGPCITCQNTLFNTFRLPCLRYMIVDSTLYRTVSNDAFEKTHHLTGPRFGDFHLRRVWSSPEMRLFELSQGRGSALRLRVRQFEPPAEEADVIDDKGVHGAGRKYYSIPWAIVDPGEATKSIFDFIDENVSAYLDEAVDHSDDLVRDVFTESRRLAYGPAPNLLIRDALRLWTAARFLEGGWKCCGEDKLGAEKISPSWRPKDKVALPPYIDFQFASLLMEKVLGPLSRKLLRSLQELVTKNQARNWFTIFLVNFILMHSFEVVMKHEVGFTSRRQLPMKYFDMKLIRAYQSGAKTLLAHFHYVNKGFVPFRLNFDWADPGHQRMAELDDSQLLFIHRFAQKVTSNSQALQAASQLDRYETPFWFIGQMFQEDWMPRETFEHSPPT